MSQAAAAATHNVFVYGSLLDDDVVRILLSRVPPSSAALLNNFQRFNIKGRVYPAILPVPNSHVTGKVLLGITDLELLILDEFEDVAYQRTDVEVSLLENSENLQAHAYVWGNTSDPNLYGEWDFEEWKELHKESFIKMTMGFMEELELPEAKTRVSAIESFNHQDSEN